MESEASSEQQHTQSHYACLCALQPFGICDEYLSSALFKIAGACNVVDLVKCRKLCQSSVLESSTKVLQKKQEIFCILSCFIFLHQFCLNLQFIEVFSNVMVRTRPSECNF